MPKAKTKDFQFDVFLRHNSQDKPRVHKLAERLRDSGLRVWFDDWVVQPGDDIYLQIEQGLELSRTLILCMSPAAFGSDWVAMERSTVIFRDPANKKRRFVPLLLANCQMPDSTRRYKYIDYREETQQAFQQLLAACNGQTLPSRRGHPLRKKSDTIPKVVQDILDEARELASKGQNAEARSKCEQALLHARNSRNPLAEIKAKAGIAAASLESDIPTARRLLHECLDQLKTIPSDTVLEDILGMLGDLEVRSGNLTEGRAFLTQAMELARRLGQQLIHFFGNLLEFAVRFICPPIVLPEFFDESKGLS